MQASEEKQMRRLLSSLVLSLALVPAATAAEIFFAASNDRLVRTDLSTTVAFDLSASIHSLEFDANGTLWATSRSDGGDGTWDLYRVDDPYGTPTLTLVTPNLSQATPAIAFDGSTLYGLEIISLTRQDLVTIDTGTGASAIVGATGDITILGGGMDLDTDAGVMYALNHLDSTLHTLDYTLSGGPDPSPTLIGGLYGAATDRALRSSDLAVNDATGALYGLLVERGPLEPGIHSIDPITGEATLLLDLSDPALLGVGAGGTGLAVIPEPGSLALIALGSFALLRRRS